MIDKINLYLKENMSPKRLGHTMGVANLAKELAKIYNADPNKAYIAGLLHDLGKELSLEEMQNLTKHKKIDSVMKNSKSLLHSAAGANLAKKLFKINKDIYNAIYYHTTGRENMSVLEKIIFVADMAEPSRNFDGIEELRNLIEKDLDLSVVKAANLTILYLVETNKNIYPLTVITRNYILKEKNSGNYQNNVVK